MFKSILEAQQEYQAVLDARLEHESKARALKVREALIEQWLIEKMEDGKEYAADRWIGSRYSKLKFAINDKPKLYAFIRDKDDFSVVISRLNSKTLSDYRERKIKVPGVIAEPVYELSYRSV